MTNRNWTPDPTYPLFRRYWIWRQKKLAAEQAAANEKAPGAVNTEGGVPGKGAVTILPR